MIFPVTSWHAPFSAFMICAIGACPSSWRRSLAADGDEDSRPQPDRLTVNTYTHLLPEIEREAIDCEGDLRVTGWLGALAALWPSWAVHAATRTGRDLGAGERIRTADLPFTRRLLCRLSYTGQGLGAW